LFFSLSLSLSLSALDYLTGRHTYTYENITSKTNSTIRNKEEEEAVAEGPQMIKPAVLTNDWFSSTFDIVN
jgi:hypothetical protein